MSNFVRWGYAFLTVLTFGFPLISIAQRLPGGITPSHYKLFLDPNIATRTFSGEETIDAQLVSPAKDIVLNSLDLDISFAEITAAGKTQPAKIVYKKADEMVRFEVADAIPPGAAQIHLKFSAPLTNGLRGLYLSKSGRREYAVTQFEGTYARMMFPCFDEPGYKATFDLTVTAANGDTAISNGRIIADTPISGSNRHKIVFSTSPIMSTYLVAVAIGDWQCLENTVDGVPIRVCAEPEKKELGKFALDVASHSLAFYNTWYGIKYPFGKLDMLAIPDYEWGGMENTASIFYRDSALLFDDSKASVFERRNQAVIIAHEIAHQWFGDLVTPVWWDDIWLNEGFATWMESKPIAAWHPEWHLENQDAVAAQQIISLDSLGATRAIHGNPNTPSEIKEMFDGITYEKGGAVLSMLESYVGAETFRRGVNAYLQAHANGNATASDFWKAMAQASGKPIDQIMPTFVLQPGVPVLTLHTSCAGSKGDASFSQQRFLLYSRPTPAVDTSLWQIPVCMKTANHAADQCIIVKDKQQEISLNACSAWRFANRDAKGYYRVAYSPENLKQLSIIAEAQLNTPERIALVEDAWAMSRAGRSPVADFMQLVQAMGGERDLNVLDLFAGHLAYTETALIPSGKEPAYRKFIQEQFTPLSQEVGWTASASDNDEIKALRATLLRILGDADDPGAVATSREIVRQYLKDPDSVDGTLADPAFHVAGKYGDSAFYDQLYSRVTQNSGCNLCLGALASFKDPNLAQRTLTLIQQGGIRQQAYPWLFSSLLVNPSTRDVTWTYLKEHWSDLAEKVTSFGGHGAVSAMGDSCSEAMHDDVQQFFSTHKAPGAERAVQQSLERIEACIQFKKDQQASMAGWLSAR